MIFVGYRIATDDDNYNDDTPREHKLPWTSIIAVTQTLEECTETDNSVYVNTLDEAKEIAKAIGRPTTLYVCGVEVEL